MLNSSKVYRGSQRDLQVLVNQNTELIDGLLKSSIPNLGEIEWKSPLIQDNYKEYRDDFLRKLGFPDTQMDWPRLGPAWDGLAVSGDKVILVEAKANIPELVSPPTRATEPSRSRITEKLQETKATLNVKTTTDWTHNFYQYTNRLTYLYQLTEIHKIDAYLVLIYFMNDSTVTFSPKTEDEWKAAIEVMRLHLGIPKHHKLSKRIVELFIDVKDLGL